MKSFFEFPKVATPLSSSPLQQLSSQANVTAKYETKNYLDKTVSTISDSDNDEIDIPDLDSSSSSTAVSIDDNDENSRVNYDIYTANNARQERSVSFGPIHVRHYERIVGDHPETRVGVPLALGWVYYEDEKYADGIPIDRYECDRIRKGKFRMSSITRKNILLNVFEVPLEDIVRAEKRSKKLQKERKKQFNNAKNPTQTAFMKFGKKIRKGGFSLLKGMSYAAQMGVSSNGTNFTSALEHTF
jgi:hypothetical protein